LQCAAGDSAHPKLTGKEELAGGILDMRKVHVITIRDSA
jgi:hypothetical protein